MGEQEDHLPDDPNYDKLIERKKIVARSNTIVGDRAHNKGMVVARIIKGNIPVKNGVVHLIDKPLMIVARSLYEYLIEEGSQPGNRISEFAKLVRDKGGKFTDELLEAKDGTFLIPNNEAMARVDRNRLDYILGIDYLRAELLGLHFVRERIASTDIEITRNGDQVISSHFLKYFIWYYYLSLHLAC